MSHLEEARSLVEVIAILGAGGWALFEYGIKAHEDRVHARLHVKNVSKRVVTTFLTSWWWTYPDSEGNPKISPIRNDPTAHELAPGEESEFDETLVVKAAEPAVVVHAHVMFKGGEEGTLCRFNPPRSEQEVTQMTDQPTVCRARPGETTCAQPGCLRQSAEVLVLLKGSVR